MRRLSALIAMGVLVCGCGDSSPNERDRAARAFDQYIGAIRHHDARLLCVKAFRSTDLPPALARRLDVPEGQPGRPQDWGRHSRECQTAFGKRGALPERDPGPVTIEHIEVGAPVAGADGISRSARVTARFERSGQKPLPLPPFAMVEYRGDWKVVFQVD